MRLPRPLYLWLSIGLLMGSCYGSTVPDVGPRGTLRFKSNEKEATLQIDETRLGPIGMFESSGVLLKPGQHRIVVYKQGFFKEYKLVTIEQDQLQVLEITLTRIPD